LNHCIAAFLKIKIIINIKQQLMCRVFIINEELQTQEDF